MKRLLVALIVMVCACDTCGDCFQCEQGDASIEESTDNNWCWHTFGRELRIDYDCDGIVDDSWILKSDCDNYFD